MRQVEDMFGEPVSDRLESVVTREEKPDGTVTITYYHDRIRKYKAEGTITSGEICIKEDGTVTPIGWVFNHPGEILVHIKANTQEHVSITGTESVTIG